MDCMHQFLNNIDHAPLLPIVGICTVLHTWPPTPFLFYKRWLKKGNNWSKPKKNMLSLEMHKMFCVKINVYTINVYTIDLVYVLFICICMHSKDFTVLTQDEPALQLLLQRFKSRMSVDLKHSIFLYWQYWYQCKWSEMKLPEAKAFVSRSWKCSSQALKNNLIDEPFYIQTSKA